MKNLPNGMTFEWKKYESPYNYINFFNILKNVEYSNKVAYAYKNVQRPTYGKVILSFGNNVGNKIWVNEKLIYSNKSDYTLVKITSLKLTWLKGKIQQFLDRCTADGHGDSG